MSLAYEDIPLEPSSWGAHCYELGRRLTETHGVTLASIMWDADETLWDWMMSAPRVLARLPGLLVKRSFAHREYFILRAGMFELLWGMHHSARERGDDPWLRIWTNGYPWRLWKIAEAIPGMCELLGPPAVEGGHDAFARHPRIFYRGDYVDAARVFTDPERRESTIGELPDAPREVLEAQLASVKPLDSTLKLPELAGIVTSDGEPVKAGFGAIEYLVDDNRRTVDRFVASGRRAVRIVSRAPWAFFGRVPNTAWRHPMRLMRSMRSRIVETIAERLAALSNTRPPAARDADNTRALPDDTPEHSWTLDIPDDVLKEEWVEPMRRLKRDYARREPRRRDAV